ncbi:MAG: hypothetical protein ACOCUV_01725 [bacterium]
MLRYIKPVLIILTSSILLSGCCWVKARFTKEEIKWLNVYDVGDTLIFKSQCGKIDTTYIIGKRIRHIECNPFLSYEGFFRPILGDVYYGRNPEEKISTINSLVGLIKDRNRTSLYVSYLFGSILFYDMKEEVWKYNVDSIYVFDTSHPKAKPEYPKVIYWQEEHGIIKYITHAGMEWKRINLDFEVD